MQQQKVEFFGLGPWKPAPVVPDSGSRTVHDASGRAMTVFKGCTDIKSASATFANPQHSLDYTANLPPAEFATAAPSSR